MKIAGIEVIAFETPVVGAVLPCAELEQSAGECLPLRANDRDVVVAQNLVG